MSIIVRCACGKQFRARDEFAGKAARCPACGATLQIGQPAPRRTSLAYDGPPTVSQAPRAGRGTGAQRPAGRSSSPPAWVEPTRARGPGSGEAAVAPVEVPLAFIYRKHWYLFLPVVSWLFTVFPLVLPFLPLGPIVVFMWLDRPRWFAGGRVAHD